ncbi:PilN domain-containing protein [Oceanimonas sp. NS1]|nr:PilN domain-containing protein [Oceanimonas sp. NS1]
MLLVNLRIHQLVAQQQERNRYLQVETARLDQVLGRIGDIIKQRDRLLERMQLIEGLQQRRAFSVRLFNQMPALVPPGVYLSSMDVARERIELVGKTEAYPRVASMLRGIEASRWLTEPRLGSIYASDTQPIALSQFSMRIKVVTEGSQP